MAKKKISLDDIKVKSFVTATSLDLRVGGLCAGTIDVLCNFVTCIQPNCSQLCLKKDPGP